MGPSWDRDGRGTIPSQHAEGFGRGGQSGIGHMMPGKLKRSRGALFLQGMRGGPQSKPCVPGLCLPGRGGRRLDRDPPIFKDFHSLEVRLGTAVETLPGDRFQRVRRFLCFADSRILKRRLERGAPVGQAGRLDGRIELPCEFGWTLELEGRETAVRLSSSRPYTLGIRGHFAR